MDTSKAITHVSLCAGYGGIDLGLKRAIPSLRTIAFSEIEAFACANLVSKMEAGLLDPAPIWTDLKTFPWAEFHGCVDICSFGYPCQPFSAAGKRLGAEDPRHLWPFIAAGIDRMRPSACFAENVEGHISLGLPDVLQDLAGMGYTTTWCVASASECGAPHQRKRVFILAYDLNRGCMPDWISRGLEGIRGQAQDNASSSAQPDSQLADSLRQRGASGLSRSLAGYEGFAGIADDCGDLAWPSRPGEQQFAWEPPRVVADAGRNGRRQDESRRQPEGRVAVERDGQAMGDTQRLRSQGSNDTGSLQAMGISRAELTGANGQHNGRQAQPPLGRDADGLTHRLDHAELHTSTDNRTDELRLLGNGVVPATAERAFRVLLGELWQLDNA